MLCLRKCHHCSFDKESLSFCLHLQKGKRTKKKQAVLLLPFLCELQKRRQVHVRAGTSERATKGSETNAGDGERDDKIHTPKDVKPSSLFGPARGARQARTWGGVKAAARAPAPEDTPRRRLFLLVMRDLNRNQL